MSIKYFTLSAVCMLIFCMLLALSGTTDFPGSHPDIVTQGGLVSPLRDLGQPGKGEAVAAALPEESELPAKTASTGEGIGAVVPNRPLFLLGVVLIAGWVLLSFRLFSKS